LCAAAVDDVVVVVGHEADATCRVFPDRGGGRFVTNTDYEDGQFPPAARVGRVDRPGVHAALVAVDVPFVNVDTVRAVIDRRQTHAPIVRPVVATCTVTRCRSLFDEMRRAEPSGGAKVVVRAHATAIGDVQVDDDGAFRDIDTVGVRAGAGGASRAGENF
jgi:CTP:molybdopterin cytidylyltransferase MocA